jgi:hypothetical protein
MKNWQKVSAFILGSILVFCSCSPSAENSNSNKGSGKTTLNVEAKIVYSANEVLPVARKNFFLVNKDLLDVEVPDPKTVGAKSIEDYMSKLSLPQKLKSTIQLAQANKKMRTELERIATEKNIKLPPETKLTAEEKKRNLLAIQMIIVAMQGNKEIAPHFLKEVVTDSEGKIVIDDISAGDYWIMGVTETRDDYAFWNQKVTVVAGENRLLLDQNNALYFK